MIVLLDTCTFLWILEGSSELSGTATEIIRNPANRLFLSAVSAWEILLKHSIGDLPMPEPPERFVPRQRVRHGIEPLPLLEDDTFRLHRLPKHHRDPFDRLLVCQALARRMPILTPDRLIRRYPATTIW